MTTADANSTAWVQETSREYLSKLLDRHHQGASENDIRSAFRDFLVRTGIADDESEIVTETRPAADSRNKVDLYLRNTYVEFKRSIIKGAVIDPEAIAQLDGYILENARAGLGIQNGILTDGQHYLKRSVGDNLRKETVEKNRRAFDRPEQGIRLYEYLHDIIDTQARDITPTSETLLRYFGQDSDFFKTVTALLEEAHQENREHPTVAVKRKLWRELLQVAIGQNSVGDSPEYDWLYVRHTYLTTLVGVIVQAHFGIDVARYADADPDGLLNGDILRQHTGLKDITESDLFAWPLETGEHSYIGVIARQSAKFNWEQNSTDLAAALYQNTISADERKRMGEYYTPPWLAQAITEELITDPANTKVLDPACGSGTFLAAAVRHLLSHTSELTPGEQLAKLQENIVGIDLHPVAVQLAKATWVIACHDVIMAARKAGQTGETITAPLHLGDSIQLRYDNSQLDAQGYITLDTGEYIKSEYADTLTDNVDPLVQVRFRIPMSLARDTERFDNLMMEISSAIEKGDDTNRVLDNFGVTGDAERQTMETTIANMQALHCAKRNHVWAYYLRNMIRPMVISQQKVDAIIGNPPWLTYNQSADIIRKELKSLSQSRYQIWAGGNNSANQDVATLFYCRVVELYLKENGKIGMVLPHSVLRTGHHIQFRNAYYETKRPPRSRAPKQAISLDFSIKTPWDLENLNPNNFFPITSCVVFAQLPGQRGDADLHHNAANPLAPGEVEIWVGSTGAPNVGRAIVPLIHDDGTFRSPYALYANEGPTIRDRRLFFVTAFANETKFATPNTFVTYPQLSTQDKKSYNIQELNGQIVSGDNLFSIYKGECIATYVVLPPLTPALPVSKVAMEMPLDHSACEVLSRGFVLHNACEVDKQQLDDRMRSRWEKMQQLWEANRGETDTKSLTQNLNWLSKLTSQLDYLREPGDRPVRIAYTTSGRPTAALIADDQAIVDEVLYQVVCRNSDEAHYLLAVINSVALEDAVRAFRPTGLFGARHLHKHLWKLPIPEFDATNANHAELSRLGEAAAKECRALLDELMALNGEDWLTTTNARSNLRNGWQPGSPTAQAIEASVEELLNSSVA